MKKIAIYVLLSAGLFCSAPMNGYSQERKDENGLRQFGPYVKSTRPPTVPLLRLIATPEKFSRKKIHTFGYVVVGFESSAVFIHKEDFDNDLYTNAIWLRSAVNNKIFKVDAVNGKYCLIEGVFDAADNGHMSLYSGAIKSIDRLEVWSDPAAKKN
jgi:hypothetical protein